MAKIPDKLLDEIIESLKKNDYEFTDKMPLTVAETFRGLLMDIVREAVVFK